jgi:hypothetical protein
VYWVLAFKRPEKITEILVDEIKTVLKNKHHEKALKQTPYRESLLAFKYSRPKWQRFL